MDVSKDLENLISDITSKNRTWKDLTEEEQIRIVSEQAVDIQNKVMYINKLELVLKFYANDENWKRDTIDIGVGEEEVPNTSEIEMDGGRRAKTAIAETKGGN